MFPEHHVDATWLPYETFANPSTLEFTGWVANLWTWWLTRNVEWDVRRIKRLKLRAAKDGQIYGDDDVRVYHERQFYSGLQKAEGK